MMKVIRVSGCHGCDKAYSSFIDKVNIYCLKILEEREEIFSVNEYCKAESLPYNCPLDDSPDSFNPVGISRGEIEAIHDIVSPAKFDKQYKGSAK